MDQKQKQFQSAFHFSAKQVFLLILLGLAFWLTGALTVQFGSPHHIFGGIPGAILFVLTLPIAWISVILMIKITNLKSFQFVPGISIGLAAATFFDGVFLTWIPSLYGSNTDEMVLGAAWILWGAFAFIGAAFFEAYRREKKELYSV